MSSVLSSCVDKDDDDPTPGPTPGPTYPNSGTPDPKVSILTTAGFNKDRDSIARRGTIKVNYEVLRPNDANLDSVSTELQGRGLYERFMRKGTAIQGGVRDSSKYNLGDRIVPISADTLNYTLKAFAKGRSYEVKAMFFIKKN